MRLLAGLGLLALLLAPPIPVVAQSATPAAASLATARGDFAGLVDIDGGRNMYLTCRGEGGPTVILVAGYRDRGDPWSTDLLQPASGRTLVLPGVATFTRVCAYDRPGTVLDEDKFSRSDPTPQPQTAAAAADLHALLGAAAIPGPYVLVGHSYGGLIVRLYASTYPAEVAGLVLVDALPAVEQWLTPEQWAGYQQLLNQRPADLADYRDLETIDLDASAAQMREAAAAAPLRSLPLVVLTRVRPLDLPPDLPADFSAEALERAWAAGQAELAALAPDARRVVATESGHGIQLDQPDLVIDAIRQVVDAVRDPRTWPTPAAGTPTP